MTAPAWQRRYRAARVTLPTWAHDARQRVTYATNASGVWQVRSWDLDGATHHDITDKPTGVRDGQPLPDGSGVVWFDDGDGDEVGRYVVTPFEGGAASPLAAELPAGWSCGLSLRGKRAAIGVAVRAGGFTIHVQTTGGLRQVYTHAQPAAVGGLSGDASLLAISHTEHGDTLHPAVFIVDAASGERHTEISDGAGNTVAPASWSPVAGDQRLAVLCDRSGRLRPEVWDAGADERTPLDLDLPGEVWVAGWWPGADALLLGHDHLGRTSLLRYDLQAHEAVPLDLAPGTIRGARVRPDGAVWYAFSSSATPPQVRTLEASGTDRALLVPPGDPAPPGVAYRSLHYDNGDGGEVHAFLATPPSSGQGPPPVVVDVHGGPHAQAEDVFDPHVQAWVDHGFAVFMPNYRGSTGYGKAWEDALTGDPGRPELVDLLAGLRHVTQHGHADSTRAVIAGGSWGGYLALQAIGTQPDVWSAAIAIVPVADYLSAYADEAPALQEFDRSLFGGTPQEIPELYADRSPITHVDQVRTPVLIITGRNDTRCPIRQVDNYVAALADRGVPHTYDVFDAGHGSLATEEAIRQQVLALDFAAEHLGTPRAQR